MFNPNTEKTAVEDDSSVTTEVKQDLKLSGKYFSFPVKSRKNVSLKNEENHDSAERLRSSEDIDLPAGRNLGFFKNIKRILQVRKLTPCKSKQKINVTEFNKELSKIDESLISVSVERLKEIQEHIETPEIRCSSNPVDSYIAALMFNGENKVNDKPVSRFSEFAALKSNSDVSEQTKNLQGENSGKNSRLEGTNSSNFKLNDCNQGVDLPKKEVDNENYQYNILAEETISPVYGDSNKDDFEMKSRTKATLTEELLKLSKYGWYWGPICGEEADSKLINESDGAFLVRDSSDDRYLLTLSFKSSGKLLHARMEHSGGLFSLCNHSENHGYTSVADLINHSMSCSQSAVFCYSRPRHPGHPSFPVRLTKPVSRFTQVRSLQYLCRFVIRQNTRLDNIHKLPLPKPIRGYIEEAHY